MNKFILLACALLIVSSSYAQKKVPNLGDKKCSLWVAVSDRVKIDPEIKESVLMMDWWALGYLKGMSTQYAYAAKTENPLVNIRDGEDKVWMLAYCRVNPEKSISDAALEFLQVLESR